MTPLDKAVCVAGAVFISLVVIDVVKIIRKEQEFEYDKNWFGDMPFCERWKK